VKGSEKMRTFILDKKLDELGISVAELSRKSDVNRSTIDDIRRNNGSGRRRDNIEKLATALGLTYEDLFEESSAVPYAVRNSIGFDAKEMIELAERFEAEGNRVLYERLSKTAPRIGVDVEALLDEGDSLLNGGNDDGARGVYARAKDALQLCHFPRMKKSLRNYLDLCAKEGNVPPIKFIYDRAKDCGYEDVDFFAQIGTFFARTRQSDALINECFDIVDHLIELRGTES
jgi:transcriptional regulator with XRE-family HTH domain